ncbi:DUF6776 family protein [Kangiella sp. TOML190]|uniref:DUF6776 family protein n=1 Tax=Kangiella sp. TOML190 TaxID=2931351 RepID=UPI00203E0912|nr:DUF6776 family protein [Kangiella sp. TOML190]
MNQDTHKPDYVIRKRKSSQWYWAMSLLLIAILGVATGFGYWLNLKRYDFSETAEQQLNQLQASLKESNASAVRWQQQYEVEKQVNTELRKHTMALELQLNNRKKETEAYQRIFDPNSVESGLQIASFAWEPVNNNQYNYRLILIQAKQQTAQIRGSYELTLVGETTGEVAGDSNSENVGQLKEISFDELESLTAKDRKFRFQYMQNLAGQFKLPDNFYPKFIRVTVTSAGKGGKSILQDFNWTTTVETNANRAKSDNSEQNAQQNNEQTGGSES